MIYHMALACLSIASLVPGVQANAAQILTSDSKNAFVLPAPHYDSSPKARIRIHLDPVVSGVEYCTDIAFLPSDASAMLVVRKSGEIHVIGLNTGEQELVTKLDVATEGESGLLSVAFHPKFPKDHRIFLNYISKGKDGSVTIHIVSRPLVQLKAKSSKQMAKYMLGSEEEILAISKSTFFHNGGDLVFGPDGLLYIGVGDDRSPGSQSKHAQDAMSWLGKVLRIDVDRRRGQKPYEIPAGNLYSKDTDGREEIYVTGVRNPWRLAFDGKGSLIVPDVGDGVREEITIMDKPGNLGWPIFEGTLCRAAEDCKKPGYEAPLIEYDHGGRNTAIIGGEIYQGKAIAALHQRYVYGDVVTGNLFAADLSRGDAKAAQNSVRDLGRWTLDPVSINRSPSGDIFICSFGRGVIYQILPER